MFAHLLPVRPLKLFAISCIGLSTSGAPQHVLVVQVADLRGHAVFKVTGTRLIESGTSPSKDDPK